MPPSARSPRALNGANQASLRCESRSGSSVRIAPRRDGKLAMNFICHTGLVDRFRETYGETLAFEGNRTIIIDPEKPLREDELRHCIGMALTYFL